VEAKPFTVCAESSLAPNKKFQTNSMYPKAPGKDLNSTQSLVLKWRSTGIGAPAEHQMLWPVPPHKIDTIATNLNERDKVIIPK
jgi:hypothetical protein